MNDPVAPLLEEDHNSLGKLLTKLDRELAKPNSSSVFELLDLFWARLAVHIRAENLHLFPQLAKLPADFFTGRNGVPTSAQANETISRLRSDHDFFMKELSSLIKTLRKTAGKASVGEKEAEELRQRLTVVKKRLDIHNRLEERQVYVWPSLLLDEQSLAELRRNLRRELENLPPRFS